MTNKEARVAWFKKQKEQGAKLSIQKIKHMWKNNGWTRIEPDGSNLPKEKTKVRVWSNKIGKGNPSSKSYFNDVKSFDEHVDNIQNGHMPKSEFIRLYSHWRPIKEKPPIW